jgi:hypothetical protein
MAKIQQFDFNVDLLKAILWQYNTAENLQSILEQKQSWYDASQKDFWNNWYQDVFDLNTANQFGLTVWSIILDVPIIVILDPTAPTKPTWGFGDFNKNYENGNFSRSSGGAVSLTIEQARTVLKLRYYQITSRGTVTEINSFLKSIFSSLGTVYVRDNLDMTITYVFDFQPSSQLQFVLEKYDILPRPAGVGLDIVVETIEYFGFADDDENFDNGNFGV